MNVFSTLTRLAAATGLLLMSGLFQPANADVCNPADADFDPASCPTTTPTDGSCDPMSGAGCEANLPPADGSCDPMTGAGCEAYNPPTDGSCDPMTGAGCEADFSGDCPAGDPNCTPAGAMDYEAGVQAGILQCQMDPASCGISVSGDTGELQSCASVDDQFSVHIPCVMIGDESYEAQLIYQGNYRWNLGPVAPRQTMEGDPSSMGGGDCLPDGTNCSSGPAM